MKGFTFWWLWCGFACNNTIPALSFHVSRTPSRSILLSYSPRKNVLFAAKNGATIASQKLIVGEEIGSGSYGTVHHITLTDGDGNNRAAVGKRPWTRDELMEKQVEDAKERADRCRYYWEVEDHCFAKLPAHPQLPPYLGVRDGWMIFGLVGDDNDGTPAPTLEDLMKADNDCSSPRDLGHVGKALECESYAETLDRALESLLQILDHVHQHQIVHRDIKPGNLLVHDGSFLLMDFGSAADLEPISTNLLQKRRVGLDRGNVVAVSPIYCAPEIFIDIRDAPTAFDIFSTALLFCQLLFSYLDERTDAGFHQQLEEAQWDLSAWLSNELGSKLRPGGLDHALEYLAERPGLWRLLEEMLNRDPVRRPTAKAALKRLGTIQTGEGTEVEGEEDGPFFRMVIEAMETCPMPTISRPLHYVATFSRSQSLGLVLSEMDEDDDNPEWKEATKFASPGEVFIKEIVPGGQADGLGDEIFEVGDQLQGIGELPFLGGGFERAVEMLQDQPRNAKNVKLHFDRISVRSNEAIPMVPGKDHEMPHVDLGAWSTVGRRKSQEDSFVLHEIHDAKEHSVLVAGVMDGHGGSAASTLVANEMPGMLSKELVVNRQPVPEALRAAWQNICQTYQQQCTDLEECRADYDPVEGKLMANTGGEDLIPGTTISILSLDEATGKLTALNCGDSRSLVVTSQGGVKFVTQDHTPQFDEERLREGKEAGLGYSLPKCRVSRWSISVGVYEYSVARSLEGPMATSKGIVSDPDVSELSVDAGETMISASDGLWEVMDSNEVALDLHKMKTEEGMSAKEAAKALCNMAMKKGTSDNVSAVVVYL